MTKGRKSIETKLEAHFNGTWKKKVFEIVKGAKNCSEVGVLLEAATGITATTPTASKIVKILTDSKMFHESHALYRVQGAGRGRPAFTDAFKKKQGKIQKIVDASKVIEVNDVADTQEVAVACE